MGKLFIRILPVWLINRPLCNVNWSWYYRLTTASLSAVCVHTDPKSKTRYVSSWQPIGERTIYRVERWRHCRTEVVERAVRVLRLVGRDDVCSGCRRWCRPSPSAHHELGACWPRWRRHRFHKTFYKYTASVIPVQASQTVVRGRFSGAGENLTPFGVASESRSVTRPLIN